MPQFLLYEMLSTTLYIVGISTLTRSLSSLFSRHSGFPSLPAYFWKVFISTAMAFSVAVFTSTLVFLQHRKCQHVYILTNLCVYLSFFRVNYLFPVNKARTYLSHLVVVFSFMKLINSSKSTSPSPFLSMEGRTASSTIKTNDIWDSERQTDTAYLYKS